MKQIDSFKEFINNMKRDPYSYIVDNVTDGKQTEKDDKKEDDEKEDNQSLIQYLLYASSASN